MKETVTISSLRQVDDKRPIPYIACKKNDSCYLHYHEGIEIVLNREGVMQATVDGKNYDVCAGQLLICSGYNVHCYNTADTSDLIVLVFPLDFVPEVRSLVHGRCFKQTLITNPLPEIVYCMEYMTRFSKDKKIELTIPMREKLRAMSYFILYTMIESVGLEDYLQIDAQKTVQKIMDYIRNNYMYPIKLSVLAQATNYSPSRLSHLFNEYFRCTFTQYLNSRRCKNAVQLLRKNEMSVLEISEACGYESLRTFYRAFKRIYGVSPLQYIKQERQNSKHTQNALAK